MSGLSDKPSGGAGTSNVGGAGVYEAGDQRTYKDSELRDKDRYNEGKAHSHNPMDSKDERSIANKLGREEKRQNEKEPESEETKEHKKDATLPAKNHGNEPSKGAKIDQEIAEEEAELLKKKGADKPGSWGSKQ